MKNWLREKEKSFRWSAVVARQRPCMRWLKFSEKEGKKVIVTTSTHLQTPPEEIRAWNIEEVRSLWKSDQIAVIGTDCESNKNLAAGDQAAVNQMENKKSVKRCVCQMVHFYRGFAGSGGCTN